MPASRKFKIRGPVCTEDYSKIYRKKTLLRRNISPERKIGTVA